MYGMSCDRVSSMTSDFVYSFPNPKETVESCFTGTSMYINVLPTIGSPSISKNIEVHSNLSRRVEFVLHIADTHNIFSYVLHAWR